ncbi:hypothetical protein ACLOJK_013554 [Asimina triloba]
MRPAARRSIYVAVSLPKARTSDDTSVSMSNQFGQVSDEAVTAQDVKLGEVADPVKSGKEATCDEAAEEAHFENEPDAAFSTQENILDAKTKVVEIFNQLNIKLGSGNAYTLLAYGSSATLALWISSAIVNAIDSIPLFPKVMELVGLIFTIWFSYRYVIFKEVGRAVHVCLVCLEMKTLDLDLMFL